LRLAYNPDGSLSKAKLVNPPLRIRPLNRRRIAFLAAVKSANPLSVPAQYRPFYEQMEKTRPSTSILKSLLGERRRRSVPVVCEDR